MITWLATSIGMIILITFALFYYLRYSNKLNINFSFFITIDKKRVSIIYAISQIISSFK
jgi:hypothetical protein